MGRDDWDVTGAFVCEAGVLAGAGLGAAGVLLDVEAAAFALAAVARLKAAKAEAPAAEAAEVEAEVALAEQVWSFGNRC